MLDNFGLKSILVLLSHVLFGKRLSPVESNSRKDPRRARATLQLCD